MKNTGKLLALGITAAMLFSGCGSAASGQASGAASASGNESGSAGVQASSGTSVEESASSGTSQNTGSDSLIVYFDYSENMGDTSNMDVDAITSASLAGMTIDGITENDLEVMKDEIQKQTGADVYSVQITEPYDPDYEKMVNVAQEDQNNDKQFSFKEELPDLSGYNTIYLGMPVWWGGLPQPMASFLEQNDFSGKNIIPFGIHLGSQFGRMIDQIQELQPNATVSEDGLTENSHTPNDQVVSDVDEWLNGLS